MDELLHKARLTQAFALTTGRAFVPPKYVRLTDALGGADVPFFRFVDLGSSNSTQASDEWIASTCLPSVAVVRHGCIECAGA